MDTNAGICSECGRLATVVMWEVYDVIDGCGGPLYLKRDVPLCDRKDCRDAHDGPLNKVKPIEEA